MLFSLFGSALFRWFLGGWMKHISEVFPFYAPYPTSYKRFMVGSFAPTGLAWSYDNRTAAFRIIGHGSSLRIECRVPGADGNPYLAFAATLAAGLDGVKNKIEPPPICRGFQLLAVASGSILITHIPDEIGEAIKHFVRIEPQSHLAIITGNTNIEVQSKHHQVVGEISSEWRIMAKSEDGIIEALEHNIHPWMISVLWHPEISPEDPNHQNIFGAFFEAAGGKGKR